MSPLARALVGVALGSCLTLFIHPHSRPYMTGLMPRPQDAHAIRQIQGAGSGPMEAPGSTAEAGLWMQLGCSRLASGQKLSREELESLVALARHMQKWEKPPQFDNAFWPQMEAVFLDQLGDQAGARKAWLSATKCALWRDYQSARLLDAADNVESPLAWHFAGLYYERRFVVGQVILDFAKRTVDSTGKKTKEDFLLRYATLMNGRRIAGGAQSVEILRYAGAVADLAVKDLAIRPPVQEPNSPPLTETKMRENARGVFYDALTKFGMLDQSESAKEAYLFIDTQPVLTRQFRPAQAAAQVSTLSVVTAALPDALLIVALLGVIIWPLGLLVVRFSLDHPAINLIPAIALGATLSIGALLLQLPPLAAVVAILSALFLVYTPKNERSRLPSDLGPAFNWTVGFLALLFILTTIACLSAVSTPAKLLLPSILESSPEFIGNRFALALIGLGAILVAILLLVAPMWAFVRRVRTPLVLGLALKTFGTVMFAIGLGGAVLLSPICVYLDSTAKTTLVELVGNEPRHYINIFS